MAEIAYLNGRFVAPNEAVVSIEDRGFQFADGVYEVVASFDARPFALDRHLRRLQRSLDALRIPLDTRAYGIEEIVGEAIGRSTSADTLVYIQITRGAASPRRHEFPAGADPTVIITISPLAPLGKEVVRDGVSCITVPDQRWGRCDIKSVALLPNVLARQQAIEAEAFEALLIDDRQRVMEGASTSSFCVHNGMVKTTPLSSAILPGITRELILEVAPPLEIRISEADCYLDDYLNAEEVFIAGTSIDTLAVVRLDDRTIGSGKPGPVTRQLGAALANLRTPAQPTPCSRS